MKKLLILIDIQNDFVNGALGTKEAESIIPNVVDKIRSWDGDVLCTRDTHRSDYLETKEGRNLPVIHCIEGTKGHMINDEVMSAIIESELKYDVLDKYTFGSIILPDIIRVDGYDYIELVGLCTDICVVSNAMILKANFPKISIVVDASCCAGVTPETHKAALTTMKMCQIDIIGE